MNGWFIQAVFLLPLLTILTFFGSIIIESRKKVFYISKISIYLTAGLVGAGFTHYLLSALNFPYWVTTLLLVIISLIAIFKSHILYDLKILSISTIPYIIFLSLGIIILSSSIFFEGFDSLGNIYLHGANSHDALWHIALQESIKQDIPPDNPLYLPEKIRGYHFLTDIIVSLISQATTISIVELYLKWFPLILTFLFVSNSLVIMMKVTTNKIVAYLGASLIVFGSGFAYLAPLFFPSASNAQSVFWLDQPTHYLVNQQLTFSLILMNVIFILVLDSFKRNWLPIGILLGSLAGIKIYGFIILISTFTLLGIFYLIAKKEWYYIRPPILGLIIAVFLVSFSGFNSEFPFIFYPGWFIATMYEAKDRLNLSEWEIHRQLFLQTQNYLRLAIHWLSGLAVFLIGNFNLKLLGFPLIILMMIRKNNIDFFLLMLGFTTVFSIGLPLLVIQKGVVWNTIQFMHYSQIPLVLGIVLFSTKYLSKVTRSIFILIILLLALPTTLQEIPKKFNPDVYHKIDYQLVEGMANLNKIIPQDKILIVGSNFDDNSLVPALSKRAVYLADPTILDILRIDYTSRLSYITDIEGSLKHCSSKEVVLLSNKSKIPFFARIIFQNNFFVIFTCEANSVVSS